MNNSNKLLEHETKIIQKPPLPVGTVIEYCGYPYTIEAYGCGDELGLVSMRSRRGYRYKCHIDDLPI